MELDVETNYLTPALVDHGSVTGRTTGAGHVSAEGVLTKKNDTAGTDPNNTDPCGITTGF